MYVYIRAKGEDCLWVAGFYDPTGKFIPESDWDSRKEAAERVHWLNGGNSREDLN